MIGADWMAQGACLGVDPNLFFPPPGAHRPDGSHAKRLCRTCPVQMECLEHALENHELFGVWGGTTERDRRRIRREQARRAA